MAARTAFSTARAVTVAAKRMRDRLGYWIREEVRRTVAREEDVEAELAYFVSLFGPAPANGSATPNSSAVVESL